MARVPFFHAPEQRYIPGAHQRHLASDGFWESG